MPYSAEINRTQPACILFLVDQSRSMDEPFAGQSGSKKSEVVADAINRLLQNLVLRCAKADGVRDYFHIGVVGYGKQLNVGLGADPAEVLVPVSVLADRPLRVDTRTKLVPDGTGGVIEQKVKFPVWFDPYANGPTPMCEVMEAAERVVEAFVSVFPNSFPPIVLNLTDGKPSDGNPQSIARRVRGIKTTDGNCLLFNLLISTEPKQPMYFPADGNLIIDLYSKLLFLMSSELPPRMAGIAKAEGFAVDPGARGVVFNADPTAVVRFLDIGTRVTPTPGR